MAGVLQHLRSSTLNKRPNPASMVDGQIAINYASGSPGAFFKDTNGNLVKVGPVHVGATAPNVSPASGGTAGNSLGEQWLDTSGGTYVFKIWDGAAWRSEAGEFVNSTGDTMTGSLTMGPSANLIFEGSTDDGFETTLTVVDPTADRTITLPNVSGTVVTTGDSGTVTSTMIADGTIVNADVNASAAIAGTKISPDFGSQTIQTTGVFSHAVGSTGAPTITFTGDTNTGIYSPGADQVAISTGGSDRLFVDASGNVGINTSSPSNILQIEANTNGSQGIFARNNNTGSSASSYIGLNTSSASFTFRAHSALHSVWPATALINADSGFTNGIAFNTGTTAPIAFFTNNNERLRITSAGRVGIGTSSPTTNVHIGSGVGGADLGVLLSRGATTNFFEAHDGTKNFIAGTDSSNAFVKVGSLTNHPVAIVQSNAAAIYIDTSKRVGIGTTSPAYPLHVVGAITSRNATADMENMSIGFTETGSGLNYSVRIGQKANTVLAFEKYDGAWQETVRIDGSGRVGIGTTSPRQALTFGGLTSSSTSTPDCIDLGATYTSTSASTNLKFKLYVDSSGNTYGFTVNGSSQLEYYAGTVSSPGNHVFLTGGSERARIDSSGRLLVGTSSARSNFYNSSSYSPRLQLESANSGANSSIALTSVSSGGFDEPNLVFAKSRGSAIGNNTIVVDGDDIGNISFQASDGSEFVVAASILAEVDGTPGANDMPGRLVFSTTADGASSPTERMRITNSGDLLVDSTSSGARLTLRAATDGAGLGVYVNSNNATQRAIFVYSDAAVADTFRIYSNGNAVNTNSSYGAISDIKLKENIVDANSQWDDIKNLQVRNYNLKEGQVHRQIGLIAQEAELVSPGLVYETPDFDAEGNDLGTTTKVVQYSVLYMKAVKALQEAMERIETLEAKVAALESA